MLYIRSFHGCGLLSAFLLEVADITVAYQLLMFVLCLSIRTSWTEEAQDVSCGYCFVT